MADRRLQEMEKNSRKINDLLKKISLEPEMKYVEKIKENLLFKEKRPYGIMITATMSAGKSTLINSLTVSHYR